MRLIQNRVKAATILVGAFAVKQKIMSKTLILEIPDEVFSSVQKQAASKGSTAERFVLEMVLKNVPKAEDADETTARLAEKRFERWIGAADSGNSRSADNELIDADLAAEYGKDL